MLNFSLQVENEFDYHIIYLWFTYLFQRFLTLARLNLLPKFASQHICHNCQSANLKYSHTAKVAKKTCKIRYYVADIENEMYVRDK